jgi:hypothetical protein
MDKYGPLATIVLYSTNLVAAMWAIRTAALGKALWEPDVDQFPRAPVRVGGVIAIVLVAVIFAISKKQVDIYYWLPWAFWVGGGTFILFLLDIFLRQIVIVKCAPADKGTFGGLWRTPMARAIVRGEPLAYETRHLSKGQTPPASARALFCSMRANNRSGIEIKERVWSPSSIAAATIAIVGTYMCWNALATAAVTIGATLVAIAIT